MRNLHRFLNNLPKYAMGIYGNLNSLNYTRTHLFFWKLKYKLKCEKKNVTKETNREQIVYNQKSFYSSFSCLRWRTKSRKWWSTGFSQLSTRLSAQQRMYLAHNGTRRVSSGTKIPVVWGWKSRQLRVRLCWGTRWWQCWLQVDRSVLWIQNTARYEVSLLNF